jgi:hypothetical protein
MTAPAGSPASNNNDSMFMLGALVVNSPSVAAR